jgi:four helix bundle protein
VQETKSDIKKRTYQLALDIIAFVDKLDKKDLVIKILSQQLIRSGTSIGANIIEAQAGSSRKDFTNFYSYALKSANETMFWLSLIRDSRIVNEAVNKMVSDLINEVEEISKILGASVIKLKQS